MKLLVTGATGFTGSYTVPALLKSGIDIRCFVRETSHVKELEGVGAKTTYGNLDDPGSLQRALKGVDTLLNIASIGFGHAPGIVHAAREAGIRRAVFISTTAIFTQLNAASKKARLAAEKVIEESGLAYTIIRPTMIYGSSRDRNICRLIRFVSKYPVIPVFGDGHCLQQPIHVGDLAQAMINVLKADNTAGKAYNVAGARPLTFNELIDTVSNLLGKRIHKLHLPAGMIARGLRFIEKGGAKLPISSEQVLRLNEDKRFDYTPAANDFGFRPRTFAEGVRQEIEALFD